MINMRERLIELLNGKSIDTTPDVEYVADYLLDNGVIVPPCKVGDTVYNVLPSTLFKNRILEEKVERFYVIAQTDIEAWNKRTPKERGGE